MVTTEAIDAAISAHSQWKKRLLEAVSTGKSEFKPEVVRTDNACPFGKWLYGLGSAADGSEDYKQVKALHAEFHKVAGEILVLALSGRKAEAEKQLSFGGGYGSASGRLILALQEWKSRLSS